MNSSGNSSGSKASRRSGKEPIEDGELVPQPPEPERGGPLDDLQCVPGVSSHGDNLCVWWNDRAAEPPRRTLRGRLDAIPAGAPLRGEASAGPVADCRLGSLGRPYLRGFCGTCVRSSRGDAARTIQNEAPSIQIECWRLSRTRMTALLNSRSHSTELATMPQRSQSLALRLVVENAC